MRKSLLSLIIICFSIAGMAQDVCLDKYKEALKEYNSGNYIKAQNKFVILYKTCDAYSSQAVDMLKKCSEKLESIQTKQAQEIANLKGENKKLTSDSIQTAKVLNGYKKYYKELNDSIKLLNNTIASLNKAVDSLRALTNSLKKDINSKDTLIDQFIKTYGRRYTEAKNVAGKLDLIDKELGKLEERQSELKERQSELKKTQKELKNNQPATSTKTSNTKAGKK